MMWWIRKCNRGYLITRKERKGRTKKSWPNQSIYTQSRFAYPTFCVQLPSHILTPLYFRLPLLAYFFTLLPLMYLYLSTLQLWHTINLLALICWRNCVKKGTFKFVSAVRRVCLIIAFRKTQASVEKLRWKRGRDNFKWNWKMKKNEINDVSVVRQQETMNVEENKTNFSKFHRGRCR